MDFSDISDNALFSMLNFFLLNLRECSQLSHETYKRARRSFLLQNHPDKGSQDEERVKRVNALWTEYTQRYSQSPSGTPTSTPRTPEDFCGQWPEDVSAFFLNALPGTQANCYFVLAPYVDLVPLRREVEKLKLEDMFLGKRPNATGVLGIMISYRVTYSSFCKKVDKVCQRGSKVGCSTPKRYKDIKKLCYKDFTDGFDYGHLDVEEEQEPLFDLPLMREYALAVRVTDPVLLHGIYMLEFTVPLQDCTLCTEDMSNQEKFQTHRPYHIKHHQNALAFKGVREQKKACQHATDAVHAFLRLKIRSQTPEEFFVDRLYEVLEPIARGYKDIKDKVAQGVLWSHMCPGIFKVFIENVYSSLVQAQPKKRGLIFQGPFDCGKTSVAQAIRDFFMGATLNVNLCKDRLHFELGGAIDMRMVLFDDVTGAAVGGLEGGWGFRNLDSLRDHLDGCVPVGLERKHQQRIEQRFPPWILTCNEYTIPPAILARGTKFTFRKHLGDPDGFMQRYGISRAQLVSCDSFALAMVLYLPEDFFPQKVQPLVHLIKEDAEKYLAEIEGGLLDLECREEMLPPSPEPQEETQEPSNPLLNFIYRLNKRARDEEDPDEGPSAKR